MRRNNMKTLVLGLLLSCIAVFSYAQESESTRIARENQYGGKYNPREEGGSMKPRLPVWGVIAIDTLNFSSWGSSHSTKGLQYANSEAVEGCEEEDGDAKCQSVINYGDGMCGAVALTPKGFTPVVWSAEKGTSKRTTEKAALKSCNEKLKTAGITGQKCVLRFPVQCID